MKKILSMAVLFFLLLNIPGFSSAANVSPQSNWTIEVGPFLSYIPRYSGAGENKIFFLPYVSFNWKNRITFDTITGLGYNLYTKGQGTKVGVGLGYSLGRSHRETAFLRPFNDIGYYGMVNAYAKYLIGPVQLTGLIERSITHGYKFLSANVGFNLFFPAKKWLLLQAGPSVYFGNRDYMNAYYGVTSEVAAKTPGLTVYNAPGGLESAKLDVEAFVTYKKHWIFNPIFNYIYLFNKAANSSVVKNRHNYVIGGAIVYRF